MKNLNWRKVLSVHIKEKEPEVPAFIVYRNPHDVLEERTISLQILDEFDNMIQNSVPDEDDIDEMINELWELFPTIH